MVKIACIWQKIDIYSRNFSTVMDIQIIVFQIVSCIQFQARQKQYRVDLTKIGLSAKDAGTLEGSGGMFLREILTFSFSKIHIWHILREN